MKGKIYALENPINNEIFYIGATTKSINNRLDQHYKYLQEAIEGKRILNKRLNYLKNLLPIKASIKCLEECETNLYEKEIYYIEVFTKNNHPLINGTKGGIGGNTYLNLTEQELKEVGNKISIKLKNKPKPIGFAENLSIQRQGINNPQAGKTKYDKVVLINTNTNKAIRIFQGGYEINEHCADKYAAGNIIRKLIKTNGICTYGKSKYLIWKFLNKCSEEEIKDIV